MMMIEITPLADTADYVLQHAFAEDAVSQYRITHGNGITVMRSFPYIPGNAESKSKALMRAEREFANMNNVIAAERARGARF